eukprot:6194306-Pleurochrysis_carterae.AAC.2
MHAQPDSVCAALRVATDSFLERLQQSRAALGSPPAATVALALEQQLVDAVPVDAHDVQMDMLCLPTRLCARPTGDTAS